MRKLLVVFVGITLISTNQVAFAADTLGCPEYWTVDTKKFPNPDLQKAQRELGPKMIVNRAEPQIIEFRGEQGISPEIKKLETLFFNEGVYDPVRFNEYAWSSLLYLYGKSTVKWTQKVEVKNCPSYSFSFIQNVPTGGGAGYYTNAPLNILKMSSKQWAEENIQLFQDFKAQEGFPDFLKKLTSELLTTAKKITPYRTTDNFVNSYIFFHVNQGFAGFRSGKPYIRLAPQLMTPECFKFSLDDNGKQQNPVINLDTDCEFSWSVQLFSVQGNDVLSNELIIFDSPIHIRFTKYFTSILCVKGRLTKTIKGTNPKCPKGYTVKN